MLSPYQLQETDDFSYVFTSAQEVVYHVYFLDYSYMFQQYPQIAEDVYSFNIDVIDGKTAFAVTDERIGLTIVEVFKTFFCDEKMLLFTYVIAPMSVIWHVKENLIIGFGNIVTTQ